MSTKQEFLELVEAEVFHGKKLSYFKKRRYLADNPGADAVYLIRKMQYHAAQKGRIHKWLANRAKVTLVRRYSIFVGFKTKIGKGLRFPHPTGIIIGQTVEIGENCSIFQNVTIGSRRSGDWKKGLQPHIGNNVSLFSGCAVIGAITLGDNVQIGANAVMNKDAAPDSIWAGVPAREIRRD